MRVFLIHQDNFPLRDRLKKEIIDNDHIEGITQPIQEGVYKILIDKDMPAYKVIGYELSEKYGKRFWHRFLPKINTKKPQKWVLWLKLVDMLIAPVCKYQVSASFYANPISINGVSKGHTIYEYKTFGDTEKVDPSINCPPGFIKY